MKMKKKQKPMEYFTRMDTAVNTLRERGVRKHDKEVALRLVQGLSGGYDVGSASF